ncbi:MAG: MBL fold metallo-hydrolase, partial [Halanaerobiaceae bacterium]|nr:MBL fold metallo-hydrolase [Halanaerobiaceae bacterium]
ENIYLSDPEMNLSVYIGSEISLETADILLDEGDEVGSFKVLFTPGHTPGGISLYNQEEGILFSGDLIFRDAYGRTDLPGGDQKILFSSLEKIIKLPPDTLVYPGHGPATTIGEFKKFLY